jgi:hypothetical protein
MPQQTFTVSENVKIQIRACHNRVTVIGWDDAHSVAVDYPARQEGDTICVENASKVTVRAPRAAAITFADCEADIRVDDLAGRVELANIGGDVALRNLRGETVARDVDGDLGARGVTALRGEGKWKGDVALRDVTNAQVEEIEGDASLGDVGMATIQTLGGDLSARGVRGALTLDEVEGDVNLRGVGGRVAIERVGGDFIASGVRDVVAAEDIEGDAVISFDTVAGLALRAKGDVVINLPEKADAEIILDAPRGDLVARAGIKVIEEDESHLRGTLGNGGVKIQAESTDGDVIVRQSGAEEWRPVAEFCGAPFARMGQQIAAEVQQSVRQSTGGFGFPGRHGKHGWMFKMRRHGHQHKHDREPAEGRVEDKPRGPAAGSPERQAILDAIARGELSVDDAIRKLTGEE